ncbi:L-glyceraldehyde 3-phosphate reductase [Aeromicrobium senzhongii]|uniref:L-glyceraldehyde 3-phosphate reductase n=1 Tax=Aeromicrobium senzhongii TaxID=2663859 RepID=A0ABX6STJ6_9ACTN|nr:L-glyceraldehyde 3-phosphate reductase [Aeromicrobium senzhongii]MTB89478.1 L-glyceraldehyde 3-phosphate reductase [Aeromicrobium senzhongii]QNL94386.1 L-glyceraldehyde 3-phosphate reductase [Aeromicrobium senzhongii]
MSTDWTRNRVDETHRPWQADADRYQSLEYRRVGRSGLLLPPISLGLWWNFGDNRTFDSQREILRHAFDLGITHFDLANNYGPPPGSAEENFGRMMRGDFAPYRDELIISTKAGWDMWPGPYGFLGSRKYLLASLDASLTRMGLDHVDIFYSHRADPDTPVEETVGALDTAVRQGKALYVGISSYSAERTRRAAEVAADLGTPLVIHQPAYSMVNRWVEDELFATLEDVGMGSIAFTPLAQGLLTDRYLGDEPVQRAGGRSSFDDSVVEGNRDRLRGLADVARERGQTLAQLAISWVLRPGAATSALIGASRTEQLDENIQAAANTDFTAEELDRIDELVGHDADARVDLWGGSADIV